MPVTVKIKRYDEVVVTPENEPVLLAEEFDRRFGDRPFEIGDAVTFARAASRARVHDLLGPEISGKPAIVCRLLDGDDCAVLAISYDGKFIEVIVPESHLSTRK